MEVERPYAFWVISNLEVDQLSEGRLQNYALPDGEITISPSGYSPPTYDFQVEEDYSAHYDPPDAPQELTLPDGSDAQAEAEAVVGEVAVRNDALRFNGQQLMDDSQTMEEGPQPQPVPAPGFIDENVLYKTGNLIPSTIQNRADTASTGQVEYTPMDSVHGSGETKTFEVDGINTVTVHTPVVNYSWVSDYQAHNQKTEPNYSLSALILERPFTVRIPTEGQHTDYLGYGDRDYAKYFRAKQVQFPFDVYSENRSVFYPGNTWINVPVSHSIPPFTSRSGSMSRGLPGEIPQYCRECSRGY